MRVLLFAFDGSDDNPHLPENYPENCAVYTGTHDTNTVRGWFTEEATQEARRSLFRYLGRTVSEGQVSWEFVKLAEASKAKICICPLQDLLSLGAKARMNHPARQGGNWTWRATSEQLAEKELLKAAEAASDANRA
jgi:4-alpha-glucanotransferase